LWISLALAVFGLVIPQSGLADAAHLGGIATGWLYVRWIVQGAGWRFQPWRSRAPQRRPLELVKAAASKPSTWKRSGGSLAADDLPPEEFISREVDPILDKISAQGIQSLTERERRILEAARSRMARR
jgi:hypothetical protein